MFPPTSENPAIRQRRTPAAVAKPWPVGFSIGFALAMGAASALLGVLAFFTCEIATRWSSGDPPLGTLGAELLGSWAVAPGSALLGMALACRLRRVPVRLVPRVLRGALYGLLLAPLNVPLTLFTLAVAEPKTVSSLTHGAADAVNLLLFSIIAIPVTVLYWVPCGLYCGAMLAILCHGWRVPASPARR